MPEQTAAAFMTLRRKHHAISCVDQKLEAILNPSEDQRRERNGAVLGPVWGAPYGIEDSSPGKRSRPVL